MNKIVIKGRLILIVNGLLIPLQGPYHYMFKLQMSVMIQLETRDGGLSLNFK